jgi:hypothetical protein
MARRQIRFVFVPCGCESDIMIFSRRVHVTSRPLLSICIYPSDREPTELLASLSARALWLM